MSKSKKRVAVSTRDKKQCPATVSTIRRTSDRQRYYGEWCCQRKRGHTGFHKSMIAIWKEL